jgi:hypothetical protein
VETVPAAKEKTETRRNGRKMENKEKGIDEVKAVEKLKEMDRAKEEAREVKKTLEKATELETIMEVEFMASDGECAETPDLDMIDQPEGYEDKEGRREASVGKGKNQMETVKGPRKPNMMILKPRCATVQRRQDVTREIQPSQEALELEVFGRAYVRARQSELEDVNDGGERCQESEKREHHHRDGVCLEKVTLAEKKALADWEAAGKPPITPLFE